MPRGLPPYTGPSTRRTSDSKGYVDDMDMDIPRLSTGTSQSILAPNTDTFSEYAVYLPFHTNEIAYDHSVASENHHAERRAQHELRVYTQQMVT